MFSTNPGWKIPQTFQTHSSRSVSTRDSQGGLAYLDEFKLIQKKNGTILGLGSHLASLKEAEEPEAFSSQLPAETPKLRNAAFGISIISEAALPFQCKCSMKVVIPQLPDSIPRHRDKLLSFPGRRHNLFNTPSCNTRFFFYQHDFTGTSQFEYLLTVFFKILCIRL